ncbi:trans-sialidase, partial [Trypanosoma rangeli]
RVLSDAQIKNIKSGNVTLPPPDTEDEIEEHQSSPASTDNEGPASRTQPPSDVVKDAEPTEVDTAPQESALEVLAPAVQLPQPGAQLDAPSGGSGTEGDEATAGNKVDAQPHNAGPMRDDVQNAGNTSSNAEPTEVDTAPQENALEVLAPAVQLPRLGADMGLKLNKSADGAVRGRMPQVVLLVLLGLCGVVAVF